MGQDHSLHAALLGLLKDKPGLADMEVTAGQSHIVLRNDIEHLLHLVPHLFVGIEDRDRGCRADLLRRSWMNPARRLLPAQVVLLSERRHEHDLAAHRGSMFYGIRIKAADDVVKDYARIDFRAQLRIMTRDEGGSHDAAVVVVL